MSNLCERRRGGIESVREITVAPRNVMLKKEWLSEVNEANGRITPKLTIPT